MKCLVGIVVTVVSLVFALVPAWLFLLAKYFLAPQEFWQNFVVFGMGFYCLGGFQILLLFFWVIFAVYFWDEFLR